MVIAMLNRKSIILASVLMFVLLGCAFGQDKDQYAQEIAAKEKGSEQYTDQSGKAP